MAQPEVKFALKLQYEIEIFGYGPRVIASVVYSI